MSLSWLNRLRSRVQAPAASTSLLDLQPGESLRTEPVPRARIHDHQQHAMAGAAAEHGARPGGVAVQVLGSDLAHGAAAGTGPARSREVLPEDLRQETGARVPVETHLSSVNRHLILHWDRTAPS